MLSERGEDFFSGAEVADARKNIFDREIVGFGAETGHGVLNKDLVIVAFVGVAGGGFHADVGGDAAQDNGTHAAAAELEIQVSAVKRTPLAFGDAEVARLRIE